MFLDWDPLLSLMSSPRPRAPWPSWRSLVRLCLWAAAGVTLVTVGRGADARAAGEAAPDPQTLITSYAEYWKEGVRREVRPIRMEVVVTYYDPAWRNFWGMVDGAPGFMFSRSVFPITAGDRVLIEGTVVPRRGLEADRVKVTVLERHVPVPALDARGHLNDFDRLKEKVVMCEGLVDQQQVTDNDHLEMKLVSEGYRINLFHWSAAPHLLDVPEGTIVRVTGVYNTKHDPRSDAVEIDLWVSQFEAIEPIGNTATDARFARPLLTIGELPRVPREPRQVARIAGHVREYTPGVGLTLRDDTGQVIVRCLQTLPLQIGDIVEASGDPFTWGTDWLLRNALVRRATPEAVAQVTKPPEPGQPLHMASQVLELSPEEAAAGRPVEMYGIIVWCSPAADYMIVRDASGGVLVHCHGASDEQPPKMRLGLRLSGVTTNGPYAPEITATRIDYWGGALLPEARPLTLDQAMSGETQGQRVEMRGYLKKIETDASWTFLTLVAPTGEFKIRLDRTEEGTPPVGSIVAVRGICQAVANERRQLTGIELWTHSAEEIRVEQVAPADPFAVALRKMSSLRQFNADAAQNRWARVRGVVTHHLPGRLLFAQDGAEGILIFSGQRDPLEPGDVIEATGLPGLQDQRVVLREAVYRKIAHESQPPPLRVDQLRDVVETLESRLVRVQGRLINCAADPDAIALAVQSQDIVFPAFLPRVASAFDVTTLPVGSDLELTGVYEVLRNERNVPSGFRLQLRSADDIVVVQRPSWWTVERLIFVTGALAICILAAVLWVAALRRRVRKQTEQIRAQLAKEANLEAHNRDIVANASDAIFTTDLDGRFTSFNPAGERMTGFSRDEALRMNLRDLLAGDDAAGLPARLERLRSGDATITFQSRFRRRDGEHLWVETCLSLRREEGRPSGILGVVRDVSERKEVEEELRRARDAAEANTQAKSAFLANMSHEIRTPMNAVIGMSNLLLDTRLNEEQREFACTIRNGAESLLTVLNDILDFSRIEAGKLNFETVDFDLAETIDQALEMLAPRAASKQLELSAFVPPALPGKLRGDPGRLRQILLNLLGNAVKFTEQGEVTLTVGVEESNETSATLWFEVHDTGVGMAPETVANLFQPFSQADASMARRFGGTGLGLAISRQIVELQGGRIGVDSTPGEGSTFWFSARYERQPAIGGPSAAAEPAALAGVRLLMVDDHAINRRMVEHHARNWRMRCETATNAGEALALLRAAAASGDPFRVMLTDCHMPDVDGLTLAREIRGDEALSGLTILLLTAVDRRLSPPETAALGIAVVLTKPLRLPELQSGLLRALGASVSSVPTPSSNGTTRAAVMPQPNLRVLVAEDNVTNQRLIALQLGKLGCTADIANHGVEVLEVLERVEYDVILMDCQMPEMDGLETTRRIRQSGRYGRVRIVAMTANAMEGDRERCLAAGMDEYLSKPVRPDDLRGVLVRAAQATFATYS